MFSRSDFWLYFFRFALDTCTTSRWVCYLPLLPWLTPMYLCQRVYHYVKQGLPSKSQRTVRKNRKVTSWLIHACTNLKMYSIRIRYAYLDSMYCRTRQEKTFHACMLHVAKYWQKTEIGTCKSLYSNGDFVSYSNTCHLLKWSETFEFYGYYFAFLLYSLFSSI